MNDKNAYPILKTFIKTAEMSNRKFAKIAGIPPSTFQAMLDRGSDMKQDTCNNIIAAMEKIIAEADDAARKQLDDLHSAFLAENSIIALHYLIHKSRANNPDTIEGIKNAYKQAMEDLSQSAAQAVNTYTEAQRTRMNTAFDQLNPEGQAVAADQVENLTYNPKYQKKESE